MKVKMRGHSRKVTVAVGRAAAVACEQNRRLGKRPPAWARLRMRLRGVKGA
jgi:hypothetical protein